MSRIIIFLFPILSNLLVIVLAEMCFPPRPLGFEFSPKSLNQIKLDACIKMFKYRLRQDRESYTEIVQGVFDRIEDKDRQITIAARFPMFSICNCFYGVSDFDADLIDKAKSVNTLTPENIELLAFERLKIVMKNDDLIENEMNRTSDFVKALEAGQMYVDKLNEELDEDEITYQSVVDKLREKNEERLKERRKKLEEEIREIGWFFTGELTIFGIDFKQLNYKIKNTIGIGLLILIFGGIILCLMKIQNFKNVKHKDKEDKKKNKKKKI